MVKTKLSKGTQKLLTSVLKLMYLELIALIVCVSVLIKLCNYLFIKQSRLNCVYQVYAHVFLNYYSIDKDSSALCKVNCQP